MPAGKYWNRRPQRQTDWVRDLIAQFPAHGAPESNAPVSRGKGPPNLFLFPPRSAYRAREIRRGVIEITSSQNKESNRAGGI